jgi:hypothetical protein
MARLFTNANGSIDVGKTLAGLIIGLVLIVLTVYLWTTAGQGDNGDKMFTLAEAVIVGTLGITIGEKLAS